MATVSRAFSHPEKLSKSTLKKVLDSAELLQYQPNSLAQIFRSNKTKTIVVMVPDLSNAFFSRILSGIEQVASDNGFSMLLSDTQDNYEVEKGCIQLFESKRVDGILQLGARTVEELCAQSDPTDVPFVHAIEGSEDTVAPTVAVDNITASRSICEYLISLGHKKIGVIGGPKHSRITRDRLEGYEKAMQAAGLTIDPNGQNFTDFSMSGGQSSATIVLDRCPQLTALVCMSDDLAIGTMKCARELGRSVPTGLSIVGFDDVPYSSFCEPPLTTVAQPAETIGELSMQILLDLLDERPIEARRNILQAEVIVRSSCIAVTEQQARA